jgi:ABC-2 type transport system permease protein
MDYFKQGAMPNQIMALMMEGQFNSAFKDQLPLAIRQDPVIAYKESSVPTAMMVIADGDVVRNAVMETPQGPVPQALGFDRYAKRVIYDNKEFLLNSMNYLLDDKALISVRSRTIKLRKLDDSVVAANRTRIQVENAALPIFVLLIIGGIQVYIRKKKWTKK